MRLFSITGRASTESDGVSWWPQTLIEGADEVDVEHIGEMTAFLDALRSCDALHLGCALPLHLDRRAWNVYVDCLRGPDYWLSCDEVLLLVCARGYKCCNF